MHTFAATHTDELSFKAGDLITVISKPGGGWFEGTTAVFYKSIHPVPLR
jgi:hypothetical protein